MHASSEMRVPLVNCRESSLSFSSTAVSHTKSHVWFLEQATPEFISPHHSAPTSIWWHTLSVALSIACLPVVCSKCRWTENRLLVVWYDMEQRHCSNNEWCILQGSSATPSRSIENFYTVSVWNFILFLAVKEFWKSTKSWQSASIEQHPFSETQCIVTAK